MSTVPNVVPLPHVQVAVQLFQDRLAEIGAKIRDDNGLFGGWFASKRLNAGNMTASAIADAMWAATLADCERPAKDRQIKWAIPPKMILREIEQEKNRPSNVQDTRQTSDFERRVRQSETADKNRREQAAAAKQALELIDRFSPLNHRTGRPTYEVPLVAENGRVVRADGAIKRVSVDALRADWTKRVADAKDAVKVLEAIKAEQTRIYSYLEKEAERV